MIRLITFIIIAVSFTAGCTNSSEKNNDVAAVKDTVTQHSNISKTDSFKEVKPKFTNVDNNVAAMFTSVINSYLKIKSALADNNEDDAKAAGKELLGELNKIDKTTLAGEQRKVFGSEEDDLKENSEHISESNIEHQRMHFSILSQSIYVLARSFGAGRTLYHFFCKEAQNNEGAMWLSESTDSKNPYLPGVTNCNEAVEKIK